ncbi:hypothetical protein GCM10010170_099930 [Dactylosporangium salmoneum]|uniref:Uncharacterized protein n=2 Tax=Dactylosporangium salmoneum TaxID=53361 RepID=A0ABP5UVA1_9ACTN
MAIVRAADAADMATAILASQLAQPGAATTPRPPAPEAAALREVGHGRAAAVHRIGEVVTAATNFDHYLGVWLARHAVVAAVISDADRAIAGPLRQTAAGTARSNHPSPRDALRQNAPHQAPALNDVNTAVATLDTVRGWLLQHRDNHTAVDLTALAGLRLPSEWPAIATNTKPLPGLRELLTRHPPAWRGPDTAERNAANAGRRVAAITEQVRHLRQRVRSAATASGQTVAAAPRPVAPADVHDRTHAAVPRLSELNIGI